MWFQRMGGGQKGGVRGMGETGGRDQEEQTSSYKIIHEMKSPA